MVTRLCFMCLRLVRGQIGSVLFSVIVCVSVYTVCDVCVLNLMTRLRFYASLNMGIDTTAYSGVLILCGYPAPPTQE